MPHKKRRRRNDDFIVGNFPMCQPNTSDEDKSYRCSICDFTTSYSHSLIRHNHTHIKPFECKVCLLECSDKESYKIHMKNKHGIELPFECRTCGVGFEKVEQLQQHETNCKSYECPICPITFKHRKDHLMRHMRIHTRKNKLRKLSYKNNLIHNNKI